MAVGTSVCGSVDAQFGQPIAPSPAEEKGGEVERLPRVVPKRALYGSCSPWPASPETDAKARGPRAAARTAPLPLADHGVTCSMSRSGNVWDNAAMERFFSSLKTRARQIAKPIGRVTRQRRMCSITSNASTMLNVGTRPSAT